MKRKCLELNSFFRFPISYKSVNKLKYFEFHCNLISFKNNILFLGSFLKILLQKEIA